jgi:ATP-dependent Lon protease
MAIILNNETTNTTEFIPLAAIREGVIFPHVEMVLTFGRPKSIAAVNDSFSSTKKIIFVSQKKTSMADPSKDDLYEMGVLCEIQRTLKTDEEVNALVHGITRVKLAEVNESGAYLTTRYEEIKSNSDHSPEEEALTKHVLAEFKKAVNLGKSVEFLNFMKLMSGVSADELADQVAATLNLTTAQKQKLLELTEVKDRLQAVLQYLIKEVNVLDIEKNIATKTQKKFDKSMREAVLRERMKTIQTELGDKSEEEHEVKEFKRKAVAAGMPKDVKKKVVQELNRFARLSIHSPEYSYIRTWLETILDMPWNKRSDAKVSISEAQKVLDQDHYGLEEVKERIIEYLSVLKLKQLTPSKKDDQMPTIICFSGPPGVGKTSIGKSIAKALGRKFIKVSLGGIRDEAEIRGHRRTYVGAMPGRIIKAIKDIGTKNPVFMLDEIDKLGADYRGDPSAALLEALDPEQNKEFSDHYLETPFDLSEVIFITTANVLDTIPPALLDRLEVIEFSGYTSAEKFEIAKQHLMEKVIKNNGLTDSQIEVKASALSSIIAGYTREAGVRNLERELSKVMRKSAKKIANKEVDKVTVNKKNLSDYLGPIRFSETLAEKVPESGLATGLAWTQVGGDIIFIEVAIMPGSGNILLTGKLGEVMQESAKAAWSYVRSRWERLGLKENFYKTIDIHIHVPEGAVPKDGPSAGDTITTAIISALTKRPLKPGLGMTGEVTLRGRILEVGGIKEKVIAAHRAGLREIIMPKPNEKDVVKIPEPIRNDIKFHFVDHMDEVLKIALTKPIKKIKS